ncbi:MAG: AEC family transporter [Lachnospiraceae bacterium]|nr:AEC family transporter [Lachnospiraceae bacterium]
MINFKDVVDLQLMLLILLLVGVFLRKMNLVSAEARKSIINMLLNALLPCMIISSFNMEFSPEVLKFSTQALIIGTIAQIAYIFISKYLFFMANKDQQAVLRTGIICSNAGYIGMPVSHGVYGDEGLILASVQCLPIRIFTWTIGMAMFVKTDRKQVIKTILTHPCIVSVFIGMVLMVTPLSLPVFLNSAIKSMGGGSTAISMMVIGMILAETDPKKVFNKLVIYFAAIRLLIIPAVMLIILKLLNVDPVVAGVSVLLAGMPAGSNSVVLAAKYNGDEVFASQNIFVSTLFSMVTIPLLSLFL